MLTGTLSRYFGLRFFSSVIGTFAGVVVLAAVVDFFELMRRGADWPNATAWILAQISIYRIPQLTERIGSDADPSDSKVAPESLASLVAMVAGKQVSRDAARDIASVARG